MAINFSAQFIVNEKTSTRVLRLTDTSTGFTLSKGNFSVTFPDGSVVSNTDFSYPEISAPGGNTSVSLITDIDNTVLTGVYVVNFVALDTSLNTYNKTETFDFNWEKPTKAIINDSDVVLPEVQFKDLTAYETSGSFTGVLTRNFFTTTPSTSEVGVITKTSVGDILTPSNASKYYEGIYLVRSDVSVLYTHTSKSWLTVSYVDLLQETYDVREAPTQDELVALMNTYKDQIEAYKTTNPDEYARLNEEYDLVLALYSHIIARYQTSTLDGSKAILDQLLGLLPPVSSYTYKATLMLPFTINFTTSLTGSGTTGTIPKFTGATSLGNSIIKEDTARIGIGKTPTTTLDVNGAIQGTSIVKAGGTSSQFLKADGSVDTSTYLTGVAWGSITGTLSTQTDLQTALDLKAPLASPTFTGTVSGITKSMVGLSNVDNTTDLLKPISTATQTALDLKAPLASPTFTGTVSGITKSMVGLSNVDNTTDLLKPISTATQTALDLKAPLASPTFTGTVSGVTKSMVGLSNVDNTSDANKPVSSATQTALNLKYDASNPSGYISGITSGQVTTALGFTPENAANKGINNGYASLDGAGKVPSSQLPSYVDDVVEVANYAALPATGETGKIYVTIDTNYIYRWTGSVYVEIKDSSAVWGAITGTLSNQTDLQNALNAKFDDPTGDTTQYIAGDGSLVTFPIAGQAGTLVREVRNTTGATLTKGTIVYISGATGNKPTVSKAIATGDSTSAQTFGMLQANIANNANGYAVCSGDLSGLDTSALTEGQQLYLSGVTAGAYTTTKSVAPIHLVYIGVVTRSHPTQGQIEVKIQNGYELDEIHDVLITSKANNDGLFYESSTSLWKNKSIATVLGYTPANAATYVPYTGATSDVILGVNKLKATSVYAEGSAGGGGALQIKQYASASINEAGYSSIGTLTSGIFYFASATTVPNFKNFALNPSGLTDNTLRTYALPDASGTIALTSDLHNAVTIGTANGLSLSTQVLSLALASTSATGALSSTDWNTFNGKQNALTNPVTGTGTSGRVPKFNGTSSLTDSIIYDNGTRVSIGADVTTSSRFVSASSTSGAYAIIAQGSSGANGIFSTVGSTGEIFRGQNGSGAYYIIDNNANTFLSGNLNVGDFSSTSYRLNVVGTGNFTGALSGTSATFSGQLNLNNNNDVYFGNTSGNGIGVYFGNSDSTLHFYNGTGGADLFKIVRSTGAATFSSSVTATNLSINTTTTDGRIDVRPNALSSFPIYWRNNNGGYGGGVYVTGGNNMQMYLANSAGTENVLIAATGNSWLNGGNVGIGTTTPLQTSANRTVLTVNGTTSAIINIATSDTLRAYLYADSSGSTFETSGTNTISASGANIIALTTNGTERMRITSGGNLSVNSGSTVAPELGVRGTTGSNTIGASARIAIYDDATSGSRSWIFQIDGSSQLRTFYYNGSTWATNGYQTTGGTWTNSDARRKTNIENLEYGLNQVLQLNPKKFNFIHDIEGGNFRQKDMGFIAQEVLSVMPLAVDNYIDGEKDYYSMNYSNMIPALVNAIKELKAELDTLKNK